MRAIAVSLIVLVMGCVTRESDPVIVTPAYQACEFTDCSAHGTCMVDAEGAPQCVCEPGYATADCARCEAGFHRDAQDRCVADVRCVDQASDPCAPGGHCTEQNGVIACTCDAGYVGPRCNVCDARYGRDEALGCLPLYIVVGSDAGAVFPDASTPPQDAALDSAAWDAAIAQDACMPPRTQAIDVSNLSSMPRETNTCVAVGQIALEHVVFGSDQSSAGVRLCAPSTFNGMTTPHVELVASAQAAAHIVFDAPVDRVQFDYAARLSPVSVSLWADQTAVDQIDLAARGAGQLDLQLEHPVSSLRLLGSGNYLQALSIANLRVHQGGCP